MKRYVLALLWAGVALALAGCTLIEPLFVPDGDSDRPERPTLPLDLQDIVETFGDLGLPDLSELPDVPQLDGLPFLESSPGRIVFRGPMQRTIAPGERVPGTDIMLLRTGENVAVFRIAGLRSIRRVGDSLDYDGGWAGLEGVTYSARLRIYLVGDGQVRIAGVQQMAVADVEPVRRDVDELDAVLKFPFVANVRVGERIPGTTYGFAGSDDRGAELFGLAPDEYPYRKMGDSIEWQGRLREDLPVTFSLRTVHYDNNALQAGGVVTLHLPVATGE